MLARYSEAAVTANLMEFKRPPGAVPYLGSSKLFTIGTTGILFKEVASYDEIDRLGGGVAYFNAAGSCFMAMVGQSANVPLVQGDATHFPELNSTGVTSFGSALSESVGLHGSASTSGTVLNGVKLRSGTSEFIRMNSCMPQRGVAAGAVDQVIRLVPTVLESLNYGSSRVSGGLFIHYKPKFIAAVVAKADAGMVCQMHPSRVIGWMSSGIELGKIELGVGKAYQAILADAPSDIRPYIAESFNQLAASGRFDEVAKAMITTGWTCDANLVSNIQTGLAVPLPTMMSTNTTEIQMVEDTIPRTSAPARLSHFKMCAASGIPAKTISGIAAWHRIAGAAPDGKLYPLSGSAPSLAGWDLIGQLLGGIVNQGLSPDEQMARYSNTAATGGVHTGYGISSGGDDSKVRKAMGLTGRGNYFLGDIVDQYATAVKDIYTGAEALIKQG